MLQTEFLSPIYQNWNFSQSLFTIVAAPPAEAPIQENGEANGEVKEPVDPNAPKKCDVIVISGRKERCEAAVEALKVLHKEIIRELCSVSQDLLLCSLTVSLPQALVPVTIEVEVPFELHRYIIGQKGSGIRKMMDEFEVCVFIDLVLAQGCTGLFCFADDSQ